MNKRCYRVVFNAARGTLMAVAEAVAGRGKASNASSKVPTVHGALLTAAPLSMPLSLQHSPVQLAILCLVGLLACPDKAGAQIIADPSAPGLQQATVLRAPNGTLLVNIQTPSAAGVSRNTYSQFDVPQQGAILNNARNAVSTQLGGWVPGNPFLLGQTARVILNEVHASDPSHLLGYLEVAGSPAHVIVANPAGITCDGCGFINAQRATLTTGVPVFNEGNLDSYRVQRGTININGVGMDATSTNYTDLIARAVVVNAGLWAKQLKLTTGTNLVDAAHTSASPLAGTGQAPVFTLDVAVLGGIYAGKILLIGTEAGVGVRNAGHIGAAAGDVVLSADGRLESSGSISGQGSVNLSAAGGITHSGSISGQGGVNLITTGSVDQSGSISGQGSVNFTAAGGITHSGSITTQADVSLSTSGALIHDGVITAQGNLTLHATDSISAHGLSVSGAVQSLDAPAIDLSKGQLNAATLQLNSQGGHINLHQAILQTSKRLQIDSATVSGTGTLFSEGDIDLKLGADYTHTSVLQANADVYLETTGTLTNLASITAGQRLHIKADKLNNDTDARITGDNVWLEATAPHALINRGLIDGRDTRIDSFTFKNLGPGRLYGDRLAIEAGIVLNAPETAGGPSPVIAARERLDLGVGTLENRDGGLILTAGDLSIGRHLATRTDPLTGQISHHATGRAEAIYNDSATIEALGEARIDTVVLHNRNLHLVTTEVAEATSTRREAEPARSTTRYPGENCLSLGQVEAVSCQVHPEVYGKRQTMLPAQSEVFAFCDESGCRDGTIVDNYAWDDPAFARLHVTPVSAPPVDPMEANQSSCSDQRNARNPACVSWSEQTSVWWQAYRAALTALIKPINAYNAGVNEDNRLHTFEDYTLFHITSSPSRTNVVSSAPALIRVGGDFRVNGDGTSASVLNNQDSQILVGGVTDLSGMALRNLATAGTYRINHSGTAEFTTLESCGFGPFSSHCRRWYGPIPYQPAPDIYPIVLPTGQRFEDHLTHTDPSAVPASTPATPYQFTLPTNSLFTLHTSPGPNNAPLIETDPAYASYRNWLSSDYLLNALDIDPALTQKRLGDGYYEQNLVRDQVAQLTGRRFLDGYTDDQAQYQALMDNGKTVAQAWQLRPGITLSREQIAQLTSDIIWLVEQDIRLADGSNRRVLVPQLYVRVREGDLNSNGTLISSGSLDAQLTSTLVNSGTIAGRTVVNIAADNLHNNGGQIDGAQLQLSARTDLNNIGGRISASDSLSAVAGRDILVSSSTVSSTNNIGQSQFSKTGIERVAGLYVSHRPGAELQPVDGQSTLVIVAGRDARFTAAQVRNDGAGHSSIVAGGDLTLDTVTTGENNDVVWDKRNRSHVEQSQEQGSQIATQGGLSLAAGGDLVIHAASVTSAGKLEANAGGTVEINAGKSSLTHDQSRYTTSSGLLSSSTNTTHDLVQQSTVLSSTLSGERVTIQAGKDIRIEGSDVVSSTGTTLIAKDNILLTPAQATLEESHQQRATHSGILSTGGIGITLGRRTENSASTSGGTTAVGTVVGSIGGDVVLQAGEVIKQQGSQIVAPGGDVILKAKELEGIEARNTSHSTNAVSIKQTGITIALTTPIITAIQTAEQMTHAAGNTQDPRMKALAAANVALAGQTAYDAVQKGQSSTINGKDNQIRTGTDSAGNPTSRDANAADQIGGVTVSISLGTSSSKGNATRSSDSADVSRITAGGAVHITTTGAGKDSNINLQGVQVNATEAIKLQADGIITLQAATNTADQHSTNKSSSASVGVVISTNAGVGVTASGSLGRGHADGSDVVATNTRLNANQVTLISGGDTVIRGGVVRADQVTLKVAGDLRIASVQDTSTYDSGQQNVGGSVTAGTGVNGNVNLAASKIVSDYQSVVEQSAIRAGDGGFQVQVKGDTVLTGGAVTSTQAALEAQQNKFVTGGTLIVSDISNHARFEANAVSVNIGTGMSPSGKLVPGGTGVGGGHDGDSVSSITEAAISGIAGKQSARTGDQEAGLKPIFDAGTVQREIDAQVQITQLFGQQASKAIGDYASKQMKQAGELRQEAAGTADLSRRSALEQQAQALETQWGEQGISRVLAHAVVGGFTGGVDGAAGAAVGTLTAPLVAQQLAKAGIDGALAQAITAVASATAGGAVGGVAGAGAATNEVGNNFLLPQEAGQREAAKQKLLQCQDDACRQQLSQEVAQWDALDTWRDKQIEGACRVPASATCGGWNLAIQQARQSYRQYDPKEDVTLSISNERSQVNTAGYLYGQRIENPLLFGVAKGLLKLSPPALVMTTGVGAYGLTTAILEKGLVDAAVDVARGIADLPAELRGRLNSTDPTVRGEALVDVLAIGSSSVYLTTQLGLGVVRAVDQAAVKSAVQTEAANALNKSRMDNGFYRDGGVADPRKLMSPGFGQRTAQELTVAEANGRVQNALPAGAKVEEVGSANTLNQEVLARDANFKMPYLPGTQAVSFTTVKPTAFVRFYTINSEGQGQISSWMMPANEVKGLSIEQIASKYALPHLPTHMTDVLVPAGFSLRITVANDISIFQGKSLAGNGGGGGVQFEVLNPPKGPAFNDWFINPREIK
jgi:filamentous hemagglutinin